jgi:hypothetical protein
MPQNGQHLSTRSSLASLQHQTPPAESGISSGEILELFHCLLVDADLLSAVSERLQPDFFNAINEQHYAALASAISRAVEISGQPRPQICVVRAQYARVIEELAQCNGQPLPQDNEQVYGLLNQIESQPLPAPPIEYGRNLARRLLLERAVYEPIQRMMAPVVQRGQLRGPLYHAQLVDMCRLAAETADEISDSLGGRHSSALRFSSDAEFAAADLRLEWLVPGVFVRGQPAIVGGPSKSLKTSVMADMAISLASGSVENCYA